jgi:hypothetical protein
MNEKQYKQRTTKHTHKTTDRATRTPLEYMEIHFVCTDYDIVHNIWSRRTFVPINYKIYCSSGRKHRPQHM